MCIISIRNERRYNNCQAPFLYRLNPASKTFDNTNKTCLKQVAVDNGNGLTWAGKHVRHCKYRMIIRKALERSSKKEGKSQNEKMEC